MKIKTLTKKRERRLLTLFLKNLESKLTQLKVRMHQLGRNKNAHKVLKESTKAAACGAGSLLQIDNFVRRIGGFEFRFSDSTAHSVLNDEVVAKHLENVRVEFTQEVLHNASIIVGNHSDKPLEVRLEHIDGTEFSKHFVVFKAISGLSPEHGMIRAFREFAIVENKGKELDGADKIFERSQNECDSTVPVIETFDAKFYCAARMNRRKAAGRDWFIRIRLDDGRNLQFIQLLEGCIGDKKSLEKNGVKKEEFTGFDGRKVDVYYSYFDDERFNINGTKYPVLIGKVVEYLDDGSVDVEHSCYFITSAVYLDGESIYTVKREHWEIETSFNLLKRQFWSKNAYYESAEKFKNVLNLILLAFLLIELVHEAMAAECATPTQSRETTYKFVMTFLLQIIRKVDTTTQ